MKKFSLLLFALLVVVCSVSAQGKIDTLYYNKDWKFAPNRDFATYYRVAYYPADSLTPKPFRDYYITGEMQASGNFIKIDATDDSNSIFDGECVSYFANGKVSYERTYKDGLLDGKFCKYDKDGLITTVGKYCNGKLSGLHTSFLDNGMFIQVEYMDGEPIFDYYIKGDLRGNVAKFRLLDHTPIWESPTVDERILEYKDGKPWQIYHKNGITIAISNTTVNDYGKWHRIDIVFSNNSIMPINFDPVTNISAKSTDKKGVLTDLEVWSAEQYIKKVNNVQIFTAVMMGIAEGMATANAGYSSSTTNSYLSGSVHAYGSSGYAHGYYSGRATSYTRTYDAAAAYYTRALSQQRMAEFVNALANEQEVKKLEYLKTNTIYPGESVSGYVHVKRIKGEKVQFVTNIKGAEYQFDWDFGKKKKHK